MVENPARFIYLLLSILVVNQLSLIHAAKFARTTRSWNCCKPSCSWPDIANITNPVTSCDRDNFPLQDYAQISSCDKPLDGGAFSCADQQPWQIDDKTSYGFAAAQIIGEDRNEWCCACFNLTFTSGRLFNRTMVVQATSLTSPTDADIFDIYVLFSSIDELILG